MALVTVTDPDTGFCVELDHWEGAVHSKSFDSHYPTTQQTTADIRLSPPVARMIAAILVHLADEIDGC